MSENIHTACEPRLAVRPLAEAGDGFLLKLPRALERERVTSALDFARVLVAAGGVTLFVAGDGAILVEGAQFRAAVSAARATGAL